MHKDYLGSILAISDEAGNKVEQRHYDAWGNLTHLQIGNGSIQIGRLQPTAYSLLLDRGYTSHEHLFEVGLIHMNGRLYDPLLRRFLNADEHIQDPYNTQNYNKDGYVYNNPLMYNDPSGEFFVFMGLGVLFWKAVIIGAAIGIASYTVGLAVTGNLHQWSLGGALKSAFWGAVSGAMTFGIGNLFSVAKDGVQVATQFAKNLGELGTAFVQSGLHAVGQGVLSVMQGGSFEQAFWSGALGSLGASGFGAIGGKFAKSTIGTIAFGALSGGIGAELSDGNFWEGAIIGGVVAGLNHGLHKMTDDPPKGRKANSSKKQPWDLDGDGRISLDEANNWYKNGKGQSITLDASKIDLNSVDISEWKKGEIKGIQTLFNSKEGRVLGNITVEYLGNNQLKIFPDTYNFEMHGNPLTVRTQPLTMIRNAATFLGLLKAGSGMQYKINFSGVNTIKP